MLGVGFFKALPTDYVIKYTSGRPTKQGQGLAFFFLHHNTQIVAVPTSSTDANFVFNEVTSNFQSVTIQGQFTFRVRDPERVAGLLNHTLDPKTRAYVSTDPERLPQRITNIIQMETRAALQTRSLEEVLTQYEAIAAQVQARVQEADLLGTLGVELISMFFTAAKPTPEVGKALEASYREMLLRKADEAVYARRAAAVEEERKIKENELRTEITLEESRRQLIDLQGDNALREAENRGKATELEAQFQARAREAALAVYKTFGSPQLLALSLNEMAQNAGNIGNLTITSEILASLLNAKPPSE